MLERELNNDELVATRSLATKLGWAADFDVLIEERYYLLSKVADAFAALEWLVWNGNRMMGGYGFTTNTSKLPLDWRVRHHDITYVLKASEWYPIDDVMEFKARGIELSQLEELHKSDIDIEMARATLLS